MTRTKPNLVATPIVDKNGKATTVLRKPALTPSKTLLTSPPTPAVTTHSPTMEERVDDLLDVMRSFPVPEGHYPLPVDVDMRPMLLEGGADERYLSKLKTLYQTLASGGRSGLDLITEVMDVIMIDDLIAMNTLCDNLDYIRELNPSDALETIQFWRNLVDKGMVQKPKDGEPSSLAAHRLARDQYGEQVRETRLLRRTKPDMYSDLGTYHNNSVYIAAVEHHAANINKLVAYRQLRGVKFVDGKDTFDEADFQRYLEQGAVAEGWL